MKWWDSSALVAAISDEGATASVRRVLAADDGVAVWWATSVEAPSAVFRLQRAGAIGPAVATRLLTKLDELLSEALEIPPTDGVRALARRLLRVHDLRAADALQLAAALVWVEHQPEGARFVCLDRRLSEAAAREGFRILPEPE